MDYLCSWQAAAKSQPSAYSRYDQERFRGREGESSARSLCNVFLLQMQFPRLHAHTDPLCPAYSEEGEALIHFLGEILCHCDDTLSHYRGICSVTVC